MRDKYILVLTLGILTIVACESAKVTLPRENPLTDEEVVYVYTSENDYASDFGNRTTADAICSQTYSDNSASWGITCSNHVALVSYSGADQPSDFPDAPVNLPTDRPFVTPGDVELASDFDDLMDGTNAAMSGAGTFHSAAWTGFDTGGADSTFNCDAWTNSAASAGNNVYVTATTDWHNTSNCSGTKAILCLCWE